MHTHKNKRNFSTPTTVRSSNGKRTCATKHKIYSTVKEICGCMPNTAPPKSIHVHDTIKKRRKKKKLNPESAVQFNLGSKTSKQSVGRKTNMNTMVNSIPMVKNEFKTTKWPFWKCVKCNDGKVRFLKTSQYPIPRRGYATQKIQNCHCRNVNDEFTPYQENNEAINRTSEKWSSCAGPKKTGNIQIDKRKNAEKKKKCTPAPVFCGCPNRPAASGCKCKNSMPCRIAPCKIRTKYHKKVISKIGADDCKKSIIKSGKKQLNCQQKKLEKSYSKPEPAKTRKVKSHVKTIKKING